MKTIKQIKEDLDPMTIWNAIKDRAAENREARRKNDSDRSALISDFRKARDTGNLKIEVIDLETYLANR